MTCKRCEVDLTPEHSSPRRCAFERGATFEVDNWRCGTMEALRELVPVDLPRRAGSNSAPAVILCNDQRVAIIPLHMLHHVDGDFLLLGWYKSRGRTELATIIDGEKTTPLTLEIAEKVLERR